MFSGCAAPAAHRKGEWQKPLENSKPNDGFFRNLPDSGHRGKWGIPGCRSQAGTWLCPGRVHGIRQGDERGTHCAHGCIVNLAVLGEGRAASPFAAVCLNGL